MARVTFWGVSSSPSPKPTHPRYSADTCLQRTPTLSTGHVCVLSHFSCVQLFATLWIVAHQAPPSVEFPRQEYCTGLPFPSPGDPPDPGIEPMSYVSCTGRRVLYHGATWEAPIWAIHFCCKYSILLLQHESSLKQMYTSGHGCVSKTLIYPNRQPAFGTMSTLAL